MDTNLYYIIDTLFLIIASVLIILMVPGFAMLEAGLVRSKNVTTTLSINIMIYAVASTVYLLWGYNMMFGYDGFLLANSDNANVSHYALFFFQMAFVGKTINIVSGGVGERTKVIPLILFSIVVAGVIYPLVGQAVWGGGILKEMHDLAGSTVIHSVGGWILLAAILVIGPRSHKYSKDGKIRAIPASNIPLVVLGALLLWIGWFGFNGGSVLSIATKEGVDLFAKVVVNTNTAGLAGAIVAALILWGRYRTLDITMILNGALGGLVAITAGADVVGLWEPIVIGAVGGLLVVMAVPVFDKFHIDDPVGALSVHLVNGIWGTIAVALFNSDFLLVAQLKGIIFIGLFTFVSAYVTLWVINKFLPFRADEEHEYDGLDQSECGVESYPEFLKSKV